MLGEQSSRTLRGSRMEDMIFGGTLSRRAMSYAEVSITMDNNDGKLPIDYKTVQISRRYFRSGESEYMINQTLCRLKDIVALFMDTGIGRDGYSIIGQGRVNDVLSNRSEDRRRIFDEAAGIVKFKTRRLDAVRKLEATDQNLVRINDTIHELEDRVGPLADQAKMAQEWQILAEQHKTLDLAMALYQLDDQEKQLAQARALDGCSTR